MRASKQMLDFHQMKENEQQWQEVLLQAPDGPFAQAVTE